MILTQYNKQRSTEWCSNAAWSPGEKMLFCSNELGGEVGEVQNEVKKVVRHIKGMKGGKSYFDDLEEELGDALICLDRLATACGIDLMRAACLKFNKTSEKHGFKTLIPETEFLSDAEILARKLLSKYETIGIVGYENRCDIYDVLEYLSENEHGVFDTPDGTHEF